MTLKSLTGGSTIDLKMQSSEQNLEYNNLIVF